MQILRIHELLKKRVLVTRERARTMQAQLDQALTEGQGEITLDLRNVEGIAPSFLDETLAMIEESAHGMSTHVTILNPPTDLSSKFIAVGRGRELSVEESEDGAWVFTRR